MKLFFGAEEAAVVVPIPQPQRPASQPPAKRQWLASELGPSISDSEADSDVSLDVDDSGHDEDGALEEEDNSDLSEDDSGETQFLFQQQGQLVAVFYWDDWFFFVENHKNRVSNKAWGEFQGTDQRKWSAPDFPLAFTKRTEF